MDINKTERFVLTQDESDFLKKLILDNETCLTTIIKNNLGETYKYLTEDAVSELYLLACKKIQKLKTHPCPTKWLFVAAKLTAHTVVKKHRRDANISPLQDIPEQKSNSDVFEDTVYNIWIENQIPEILISQLSKRERQIYYMLYIENKSTKNIADELNISENNVRNINKNLRDKIHHAIKEKNSKNFL